MFKRLLSNLPFNPSLINQVSFYAKRVHRETSIRRVGFILLIIAMFVQLFAVISPPQPTLALSSNDLIPGGFSNQTEAINHCRANDFGYGDAIEYLSLNCDDLVRATTQYIHADDNGGSLYVYGRKPIGAIDPGTKKSTEESILPIGNTAVYGRKLSSWDKDGHKSYKALVGKTKDGKSFSVLYGCGGVVVTEKPAPPPPRADDVCPNVEGTQLKREQCDVCPQITGIQSKPTECRPCDKAQTNADTLACLSYRKTASNTTQNIADANGSIARGGDTIVYTLIVKNEGKLPMQDFTIQEPLGDVLEYANLTEKQGSTLSKTNMLSWPAQDIAAGQEVRKSFTVQVKSPIPSTPVSVSDPTSYDLIMTNVYGNAINIKLPATTAKTAETTVTTLPDTGPGTSLLIGFLLVSIVGYFFARSRLIGKELDIVRREFAGNESN